MVYTSTLLLGEEGELLSEEEWVSGEETSAEMRKSQPMDEGERKISKFIFIC